MIEQGTELEANATWSTDVQTRSGLKIDISSFSSSTFKNGVPYYGTLKIEDVEGGQSAYNGTQVKICIKPTDERRHTNSLTDAVNNKTAIEVCNNYETDSSGYVHYNFFPNDPDVVYYNLKVF